MKSIKLLGVMLAFMLASCEDHKISPTPEGGTTTPPPVVVVTPTPAPVPATEGVWRMEDYSVDSLFHSKYPQPYNVRAYQKTKGCISSKATLKDGVFTIQSDCPAKRGFEINNAAVGHTIGYEVYTNSDPEQISYSVFNDVGQIVLTRRLTGDVKFSYSVRYKLTIDGNLMTWQELGTPGIKKVYWRKQG